MEVAQQESFAAMRQKRIDQMAKMHHKISSPKLREMLKEVCCYSIVLHLNCF